MDIKSIVRPRQAGKTTQLLKMSAETGYPIIIDSNDTGKHLKKVAKEMGLTIPDPISIVSIMRKNAHVPSKELYNGSYVLVDDADIILDYIMKSVIKCGVAGLAMVERNEKGHDVNVYGEDIIELYSPTEVKEDK